jgi:RHS repeat-associated protein
MSTPKVQYSYSAMAGGANHSRLTGITYPNGRVLNYTYTGLDNTISRLTALSDTSATLERYTYLGLGTVVERAHPQPNVNLTYLISGSGDGGDQYVGLDRFGRVVEQRWDKAGTATDRFQYTYDRDSNRLTKALPLTTGKDETYSYDLLNQLTNFAQGTHTQSWSLDALGNWSTFTNDGTPQSRTHNKQNQVTQVGTNPLTFDNNGNTLTIVISAPTPENHTYAYDAWNRLVQATDNLAVPVKTVNFSYDALNRRLTEAVVGGTTTHLYYSAAWQVLEERIDAATTAKAQYVWSPVYVDALVLRDRDANGVPGDGPRMDGLEERLYAQQDANYNVTALVDASGNVVLRFAYDPYGAVTLLTPMWGTPGSTQYAWVYLHQGGRFETVSALYHFRYRDLAAALGRWLQRDPIEFAAGDVSTYNYIANNPNGFTDPLGLAPLPIPSNPPPGFESFTEKVFRGEVQTGWRSPATGQTLNWEGAGPHGAHYDLQGLKNEKGLPVKIRFKPNGTPLDTKEAKKLASVIRGGGRIGSVRLSTLVGIAGTVLTTVTIVQIIVDGFDHLDCEKIRDETEKGCGKICIWECKIMVRTGILGLGGWEQRGKVLMVHMIPEGVKGTKKGDPVECQDQIKPTLYNLKNPDFHKAFEQIGVKEYIIPIDDD